MGPSRKKRQARPVFVGYGPMTIPFASLMQSMALGALLVAFEAWDFHGQGKPWEGHRTAIAGDAVL